MQNHVNVGVNVTVFVRTSRVFWMVRVVPLGCGEHQGLHPDDGPESASDQL